MAVLEALGTVVFLGALHYLTRTPKASPHPGHVADMSAVWARQAERHPAIQRSLAVQAKIEADRLALHEWLMNDPPEEPIAAPAEHVPVTVEPTARIHFKPDEPRSLRSYGSQAHLVKPLDMAIRALSVEQVVLDHKLMTGPPGLGKTLLSKVIANELQHRAQLHGLEAPTFVETYAANLNSIDALDQVVRTLVQQPASIWFIDEMHVMNKELVTKIYLLMEEGRYPFDGSLNPTPVPNCMVIGATTDYGMLHAALKRRFGEPLMLRTMTRDELTQLAPRLGFPIAPDAVDLLVSRCWQSGAPYELKTLSKECAIFATAQEQGIISAEIVQDVFDTFEIDHHGLRPIDRSILSALFMRPRYRGKAQDFYCFGGSESDICAVARLDKAEFQETIRPRLMSRGFLEVRSGVGLALTEQATREYAQLKP